MTRQSTHKHIGLVTAALLLVALPQQAEALPFSTAEIDDWLLIGTGTDQDGQAVNINNFEIGANKAPVPSNDSFLNQDDPPPPDPDSGETGDPTLDSSNGPLPESMIEPVPQGITNDGNIAITNDEGVFNLQDTGVFGDLGVQCAASATDCDAGSSDSFYNDSNQFPNTFNVSTETGTVTNPNEADPTTEITDSPTGGNPTNITEDVDFTPLLNELQLAANTINGLAATTTLDLSGSSLDPGSVFTGPSPPTVFVDGGLNLGQGEIQGTNTISATEASTLFKTTFGSGLNVVDVVTGGNDFNLNNVTWVIDGPEDAMVIFRMSGDTTILGDPNLLEGNTNILAGDGGIGLQNIVFYQGEPDHQFVFNNTILNGLSFWNLGFLFEEDPSNKSLIVVNNSQGCVQMIAEVITLNDVRYSRCALSMAVPEPSTTQLFGTGLLLVCFLSLLTRRSRPGTARLRRAA